MHESFLKHLSLLQLEGPQEIILGIGQGRLRDREQLAKRLDTLRGQKSGPQPLVQSSCTTLPSSLPTHHTHLCTLTNHYSDPTQFGTGNWCSHSPAVFHRVVPTPQASGRCWQDTPASLQNGRQLGFLGHLGKQTS